MNYLIGVSGKAGHGKDSVVSFLKQCFIEDGSLTYRDIKFADKLKEITASLLDVSDWHMNDQAGKESEIEHMGNVTGRRALQVVGTDVSRSIFRDIWVYHYMKEISDFFKISEHAHQVSGLAGAGGHNPLADVSKLLEQIAKEGNDDEIQRLVTKLQSLTESIESQI